MAAFRQLCKARNRTPEDVAQKVGLGGLMVRIESCQKELLLQHQAVLCNELGVSVSELLALAEQMEGQGNGPSGD